MAGHPLQKKCAMGILTFAFSYKRCQEQIPLEGYTTDTSR